MGDLKDSVNAMIVKLRLFSSEVTRVAIDVGTRGKLGGQAVLTDGKSNLTLAIIVILTLAGFKVEGTWKARKSH